MKKVTAVILLLWGSAASAETTYYAGIGGMTTENADCEQCDTSGRFFEIGSDINPYVGADVQLANTDMDDFDAESDLLYVGANLGPDLKTDKIRLYGKVGLAQIEQEGPLDYSESETNPAYGIGIRLTPSGRGIYLKAEGIRSEFVGEEITATTVSVGIKF